MICVVKILVIGLLLHSISYAASSSSAEIDAPAAAALQPKGLLLSKMEKKEQISLDELHDYIKKASLQFIAEFSEIIKNRASLKDLLESFDKEDAHKHLLKFNFEQENTIPQWFLAAFSFYLVGQYDQGIRASYNIIPWLSNEKRVNKTIRIGFSNLTETLLAWCCLERAYKTGALYDYLMAVRIHERLRQEGTSSLIYQAFGFLYEEKATSISNCLLKVFWWKRSADAYKKAKLDDKAKQCYLEIAKGYQEDAASSFKNNHISYQLIAEAYAAAGQDELAKLFYEKAIKKFSKLTEAEKNRPYILNAAAEVYQGLGQHEQAVHYFAEAAKQYEKAALHGPHDFYSAAEAYKNAGQHEKAKGFYTKAADIYKKQAMEGGLTQNSNPSADWDAAVDCYLKAGELEKANVAAARAAVGYILQNPLPSS